MVFSLWHICLHVPALPWDLVILEVVSKLNDCDLQEGVTLCVLSESTMELSCDTLPVHVVRISSSAIRNKPCDS